MASIIHRNGTDVAVTVAIHMKVKSRQTAQQAAVKVKYKIGQLIEDFKEVRNTHGNLPVCVFSEDAKDLFSFVSVVVDLGGKQGKVLMLMTAKEADKYVGKDKAEMPPEKT